MNRASHCDWRSVSKPASRCRAVDEALLFDAQGTLARLQGSGGCAWGASSGNQQVVWRTRIDFLQASPITPTRRVQASPAVQSGLVVIVCSPGTPHARVLCALRVSNVREEGCTGVGELMKVVYHVSCFQILKMWMGLMGCTRESDRQQNISQQFCFHALGLLRTNGLARGRFECDRGTHMMLIYQASDHQAHRCCSRMARFSGNPSHTPCTTSSPCQNRWADQNSISDDFINSRA